MNLIFDAALRAEPWQGANLIAQALGMAQRYGDGAMPEQISRGSWIRGGHALRCQMLGEWLRAEAFKAAEDGQRPVAWSPIGGERYAGQHD